MDLLAFWRSTCLESFPRGFKCPLGEDCARPDEEVDDGLLPLLVVQIRQLAGVLLVRRDVHAKLLHHPDLEQVAAGRRVHLRREHSKMAYVIKGVYCTFRGRACPEGDGEEDEESLDVHVGKCEFMA